MNLLKKLYFKIINKKAKSKFKITLKKAKLSKNKIKIFKNIYNIGLKMNLNSFTNKKSKN
jgi:hypothetical protein